MLVGLEDSINGHQQQEKMGTLWSDLKWLFSLGLSFLITSTSGACRHKLCATYNLYSAVRLIMIEVAGTE